MCPVRGAPSVGIMKSLASLRWPLITGLGALALIRPLISILEFQLGFDAPPSVPIGITVVVTVVWVAVVGLGRVARPLLTLVMTGISYGVLSIILSGVLSPILTGELQGPLAMPIAIVPVLITNAIWGLVAGALALLVQHLRTSRSAMDTARVGTNQ